MKLSGAGSVPKITDPRDQKIILRIRLQNTGFCNYVIRFSPTYLWLCILEQWCKCSLKKKRAKNLKLPSWRSLTKIAGSGSVCQRCGSADPNPNQNVMDPQHWIAIRSSKTECEISGLRWPFLSSDLLSSCCVAKLLSSSKNCKQNCDSYCFVTCLWLFIQQWSWFSFKK